LLSAVKARIVKLRFFAGMTSEEIAALLEVSEVTVRRHWAVARVWLYEALNTPA
jgi:RNA polymerase sigma factor (sigma-70 family)